MTIHSTYFGGAGIDLLFSVQGEAATYTPKGGSAAAIVVLAKDERVVIKLVGNNRRQVREREFTLTDNPAHVYPGIAAPATNATVTFGGRTYAVCGIASGGNGLWTLTCEWIGSTEKGAPEFRAK